MLGMNMKVKSGTIDGVLAKLELGALLAGQKSKPNIQIVGPSEASATLGKREEQTEHDSDQEHSEDGDEESKEESAGEEEEPDEIELQMRQMGIPTKFK